MTPPIVVLRGDANCDDVVSAPDLPALVAVLEGLAAPRCVGVDADGNATLDEHDLSATIALIFEESVLQ